MSERYAELRGAAFRLLGAVESLGKVKEGKTLFEHSPIKDAECYEAWRELHDARQHLYATIEKHSIDEDSHE